MTPADAEKVVAFGGAEDSDDALPFRVELWDRVRGKPERIIGRAATIVLAQAIFKAAQVDFVGERVTLTRGLTMLMDTQ